MKLYDREWTKRELLRRAGSMRQFGGIERSVLADGRGRGSEIAHVRTGSGLKFVVHTSRGMDIGIAEWCGIPLGWISPAGHASPVYYDPRGSEWLRSFYGGLLATCGLRHIGAPAERDGESHGLHGRIGNLPAEIVRCDSFWDGDEYVMLLEGRVREARVFGENLTLTRRIACRLVDDAIRIVDRVANEGFRPEPHMIMYHFNFGFPLLDERADIVLPTRRIIPLESGLDPEGVRSFPPPTPNFEEQVFFHDLLEDPDGLVAVGVWNPHLRHRDGTGLGVKLTYRKSQLPWLTQWKMAGEGAYVLGLEPCNTLQSIGPVLLSPGEERTYELELRLAFSPLKND